MYWTVEWGDGRVRVYTSNGTIIPNWVVVTLLILAIIGLFSIMRFLS